MRVFTVKNKSIWNLPIRRFAPRQFFNPNMDDMTPVEDEYSEIMEMPNSAKQSFALQSTHLTNQDPEFLSRLSKLDHMQEMYRNMERMQNLVN
jgi:hypothetical protein